MCDLCVALSKLKELKAFHLHFVVSRRQQDFSCGVASALSHTTANPVELPEIHSRLGVHFLYAVYYKCFPSVVKNTEKMCKVSFLLFA